MVCGKNYYCCTSCNHSFFRWKNVTCSPKCFEVYINKNELQSNKDGDKMNKAKKLDMIHPLRGCTYENNQMHDFTDYLIIDEKNNWLKSTFKNREYVINDIQYFYIPRITLLDIIKDVKTEAYSQGFDQGFDDCKKEIRKNKRKIPKNIETKVVINAEDS